MELWFTQTVICWLENRAAGRGDSEFMDGGVVYGDSDFMDGGVVYGEWFDG